MIHHLELIRFVEVLDFEAPPHRWQVSFSGGGCVYLDSNNIITVCSLQTALLNSTWWEGSSAATKWTSSTQSSVQWQQMSDLFVTLCRGIYKLKFVTLCVTGERMDVVLTADQELGDYQLVVRTSTSCSVSGQALATLSYVTGQASSAPLTKPPISSATKVCLTLQLIKLHPTSYCI